MTNKVRKRDLRTRVIEPTYRAVERYAVAHTLTRYAATERLLTMGVDALNHGNEATAKLQSSLDSIDSRLGVLTKLVDRTLYTAAIAYAYGRQTAIGNLSETRREELDQNVAADGHEAYRRQYDQALGGA